MIHWRKPAMVALVLTIALAPALAEARAGGSSRSGGGTSYQSQGSRGSRTFNNDGATPMQRSITPGPTAPTPAYGTGNGSFFSRHPFLSAMAGGFFGAWIGSLLFPGWGWGGMFAGSLFSWILIILLGVMAFRAFRRHMGPATVPDIDMPYQTRTPFSAMPRGSTPAEAPLTVAAPDYAAFEALLETVQAAWSAGDLAALKRSVTPEMLSYFGEALANNASQGVENHVEQVALIGGDVRESWDEGQFQYATALLHWSAIDFTVRADRKPGDPDYLVEGDPRHAVEAKEMWTFVRSPGGHWLLSAIQQV